MPPPHDNPQKQINQEWEDYLQAQESGEIQMSLPPAPFLLPVFLEMLSKEEVGKKNKEELAKYSAELLDTEASALVPNIGGFYIEKMKDEEFCRYVVGLKGCRYRDAAISAAQQIGITVRNSCAPKGWMEHQLSAMIQKMS